MTSVLISTLLSAWLAPQSPAVDLTGRWDVRVEAAKQSTPDGGSRSRSALTLVLELDVRGSDVSGRFNNPRGDAVTLSGTWKDGRLDLVSPWREVSVTNNGRPDTAKVRWVIKGGWKDNVLGGTWDFQMGDSSLPQRWTALRKPQSARRARGQSTSHSMWPRGQSGKTSFGLLQQAAGHRLSGRPPLLVRRAASSSALAKSTTP